jgi:hypothetical protein
VIEPLTSKCKALSLNPVTAKNMEEEEGIEK